MDKYKQLKDKYMKLLCSNCHAEMCIRPKYCHQKRMMRELFAEIKQKMSFK